MMELKLSWVDHLTSIETLGENLVVIFCGVEVVLWRWYAD